MRRDERHSKSAMAIRPARRQTGGLLSVVGEASVPLEGRAVDADRRIRADARRGYDEAGDTADEGHARRDVDVPHGVVLPNKRHGVSSPVVGFVVALALVGMSFSGSLVAERSHVAGACVAAAQAWRDANARLTQARDLANATLALIGSDDPATGAMGYRDTAGGGPLVATVEKALSDAPAFDASATPCASSSDAAVIAQRTVAIDDGATALNVAVDALIADLEPYRAGTLCTNATTTLTAAVNALNAARSDAQSALDVAGSASDYAATPDGAALIAALQAALTDAQSVSSTAPACTTTDQAGAIDAVTQSVIGATTAIQDATQALNASMVASGKVYTGENGRLDPSTLCHVPYDAKQLLRCDAEAAWMKLNAVYKAEWGEDIPIDLSYRTYDEQVKMREIYGGGAAIPGTSNHGWGTAVDLPDYREGGIGLEWNYGTPKYEWMKANAPAFGWVNPSWAVQDGPGPHEPWHFEYVG